MHRRLQQLVGFRTSTCTVCTLLVQLLLCATTHGFPSLPTQGVRMFGSIYNTTVYNLTMIPAEEIGNTSNTALWCQSPRNEVTGKWILPNGMQPSNTSSSASLYTTHEQGQIGLFRQRGIASFQGVYRCIIPDENYVNQTQLVWIYTRTTFDGTKAMFCTDDSFLTIKYLSQIYVESKFAYAISFSVYPGPPTNVSCTVYSNSTQQESIPEEHIQVDVEDYVYHNDTHPDNTVVSIWRPRRQEAMYECTATSISVDGGMQAMANVLLSTEVNVAGTPQNVQYAQTEYGAVNISWSPPQGDSNNLNYSVFIKTSDENITRVKYVADTSVALTGLEQEAYNVIVVATKPSSRTTLPSFPQTIDITLDNKAKDEEDDLAVNDPGLSRASEVRLLLGNTVLPNRTMISVDDIGNTTSTGLLCQSPLNEPNIGKWLLPNDTAPPTTPSGPLFTTHEKGQIQLFRQGAITAFQGVYRCIIPDENNISQTLLVWIYESYLFTENSTVDPIMTVTLLSQSYKIPLEYTLSFNVSFGPPSNVNCTVWSDKKNETIPDDLIVVDISKYTYEDSSVDVSTVTVRMSERIEGLVVCTVERVQVMGRVNSTQISTTNTTVNVTETPVRINATRTGDPMNNIYWELPTSGLRNLIYEVFLRTIGNNSIKKVKEGPNPFVHLPNLTFPLAFEVIVVADNRYNPTTLPSYPINITVPPYIPANLTIHTDLVLNAGSTFNATCSVMRGKLKYTVIMWTNVEGAIVANYSFFTLTAPMLSVDLTLSPVNTSNAGIYTCKTAVEDQTVELLGIREVEITVQVPSTFVVTVTSSPPPPHTEGSKVTLFCSTQLPPYVDTGVTVSAKWMRSGMNLSNIGAPTQLINGSHWSEFVIEQLNSTTTGEYTCSMTVTGNTQFVLGATVSNTTIITFDTGDQAENDPDLSQASEVRLLLGNTVLPNRTMISVDDIGSTASTGLLCQSPLNKTNIGKWLLPNNTVLLTTSTGPLFTTHKKGQIGLLRQGDIASPQGVYRCIIPDENNINQTLLVWIYESYLFDLKENSTVDPIMTVTLLSQSYIIPLEYTLSFNVSFGPPSNVNCTVWSDKKNETIPDDLIVVDISKYTYEDNSVDVSTVTVRMSERIEGLVVCTVERFQVMDRVNSTQISTTNATVNVTETPVRINATRTGDPMNNIYWELPTSGLQNLIYEVFLRTIANNSTKKVKEGPNPFVHLPNLTFPLAFEVIVVADNRYNPTTLPSYPINIMVPPYIPANLTIHTDLQLNAGSTFNATCYVMRGKLNFTVIMWTNMEGAIVANYTFLTLTAPMLSADLTLSPVNTSNAGIYTCKTAVEDQTVELLGIREVEITVQVPSTFVVTVTSSPPPPPYTEGSKVTLFCSTQLPPYVDTGVTVSAKWMRSGMNLSNIGAPTQLINGSHWSEFVIEQLNSTTTGEYTCSITVTGKTQFVLGATVSNTTIITFDTDEMDVQAVGLPLAGEVRLLLRNTVLPNRTMISVDDIGNTTSTGLLCQSPLNETNIGKWLLPNDTAPPTIPTGPLFTTHEKGQIQLLRQGAITAFQGVYRCIIPDGNNISQTLLVWIYESYLFTENSTVDPIMMVTLLSQSYKIPLEYTLSFNVSFGPPSNVNCTVWSDKKNETIPDDLIVVDISKYTYEDNSVDVSTVTVRMSERIEGLVVCTVERFQVMDRVNSTQISTTNATVNVTETPVRINATRTGDPMNNIYWELPTSGLQNLIYEVFLRTIANNSTKKVKEGPNPFVHLPNLAFPLAFEVIVVADNRYNPTTLPSYPINIMVPPYIPANLTIHTDLQLNAGSTFNATCYVMRGKLNFTVIMWTNMEGAIVANYTFLTLTAPMLSVDLTLSPVNTSNAGIYTCKTAVEDQTVELLGIREVEITVQVPSTFVVTVTSSPPPPHTEGSKVTLFCSTQLPPYVDTGVTVSAKWMRSGMNLSNIGAPTQLINGSHWSEFVIEQLNSTTAGEYTCSITVSGNTQFVLGATVSNTTIIMFDTVTPPTTKPTSGVRLYIQAGDIVLPNRTMISAAAITAITGLWCQSALNETKIGKWLLPNDTAIPTTRTGPLFTTHVKGQIGLFRQGDIAAFQGVYRCIIPDENNINQTLLVWIYESYVFEEERKPTVDPITTVNLLSPSYSIPLQYSLSFNVSFGPPTNVTCVVQSDKLNSTISDDRIGVNVVKYDYNNDNNQSVDVSTVTVKMSGRIVGEMMCNVSIVPFDNGTFDAPLTSSTMANIIVTETPMMINATRAGVPLNNIYWALPTSGPPNLIYDVFYRTAGNDTIVFVERNRSEIPNVHLPQLDLHLAHEVIVVAINQSNPTSLPSFPINITLPPYTPVTIINYTTTVVQAGSKFRATCMVANETRNYTEIKWYNSKNALIVKKDNFNTMEEMLSLDLVINPVNTSDAGRYTCRTFDEDLIIELASRKEINVTVKIPPFEVSVTSSSSYSEGSNVTLFCHTRLPPYVDTEITVSATWMHSGMIILSETAADFNGTYRSMFIIDQLNSSTAGEYNCSFTMHGNNSFVLGTSVRKTTIITLDNNRTEATTTLPMHTTAEATTPLPRITAEATTTLPLITAEATTTLPLFTAETTISLPHTTVEATTTLLHTTAEATMTLPHSTAEATTLPLFTAEATTTLPHTSAETTISLPHTTAEATTTLLHTTSEATTHSTAEATMTSPHSTAEATMTLPNAEATTTFPDSLIQTLYTSSVDTSQTTEVKSETVLSSQFILSSLSAAVISSSLSSLTDDLASTRAAVIPPFLSSIQPQNTTIPAVGGLDSETRVGLVVATIIAAALAAIIAAALATVALVVASIMAVIACKKKKNKKDEQPPNDEISLDDKNDKKDGHKIHSYSDNNVPTTQPRLPPVTAGQRKSSTSMDVISQGRRPSTGPLICHLKYSDDAGGADAVTT